MRPDSLRGNQNGSAARLCAIRDGDRVGVDGSRVCDDRLNHSARLRGGQKDVAPVGGYCSGVEDFLGQHSVRHFQPDKAVTGKIHGCDIAGCQHRLSQPRLYDTVVFYVRRDEAGKAAFTHRHRAMIYDRRVGISGPGEFHGAACHEGGIVAQIRRRCHKPADINGRRRAENNAVGIDQDNISVRPDMAVDLRGLCIADPVDRDGRRTGLVELNPFTGTDIERIPPYDRAIRRLIDRRDRTC